MPCRWATEAFDRVARPGAVLAYATNTPEWNARFVPALDELNVYMGVRPPEHDPADMVILEELSGDLLAFGADGVKLAADLVLGPAGCADEFQVAVFPGVKLGQPRAPLQELSPPTVSRLKAIIGELGISLNS